MLGAGAADAGGHHVVDEADRPLDRDLPAAGDHLPLQAARHEQREQDEHDDHEQRRVGERHVVAEQVDVPAEHGLDLELLHGIDATGAHSGFSCEMR